MSASEEGAGLIGRKLERRKKVLPTYITNDQKSLFRLKLSFDGLIKKEANTRMA